MDASDGATLARIDERTIATQLTVTELKSELREFIHKTEQALEGMEQQVQQELNRSRVDIRSNYVSKDEFYPIRAVVYGLVGCMLLAVMGLILSVALRH